ncbi:MAG: DNA gyrase inhibitor YacG [Gammaproteobacteria bacterium]|nr:DNA gyrase inhibitor YacG [Gammaproteobacteria bacterium]
MQISCPTCGRTLEWSEAPLRPFCSERCRLIDLGGWLSERNVIPGEALEPGPDGAPEPGDEA